MKKYYIPKCNLLVRQQKNEGEPQKQKIIESIHLSRRTQKTLISNKKCIKNKLCEKNQVSYLLIFLFLFCAKLYSQTDINIIKNKIENQKTDSGKVNYYLEAAEYYLNNVPDSTIYYSLLSIKILTKFPNIKKLAQSYLCYAEGNFNKEEFEEALKFGLLAIDKYTLLNDSAAIAKSSIFLGGVLFETSSEKKSMEYYNKGLKIAIMIKDSDAITNTYNDFAYMFNVKGKLDSAMYFLLKIYDLDKIRKSVDKEELLAEDEGNIAAMYLNIQHYNNAEIYAIKAYNRRVKSNKKLQIMKSLNTLAAVYYGKDEFNKALKYVSEARVLAIKLGSKDGLARVYDLYRNIYEKMKKFELATKFADSLLILRTDIFNDEKTRLSNESEAKYQNEKKELENSRLQLQNELSTKIIRQQKIVSCSVTSGLIILFILSFFIFQGLKKQREANKIISLQKQEVERQKQKVDEHQKEIIDSINYASRIQRAFLPNEKYITKKITRINNNKT